MAAEQSLRVSSCRNNKQLRHSRVLEWRGVRIPSLGRTNCCCFRETRCALLVLRLTIAHTRHKLAMHSACTVSCHALSTQLIMQWFQVVEVNHESFSSACSMQYIASDEHSMTFHGPAHGWWNVLEMNAHLVESRLSVARPVHFVGMLCHVFFHHTVVCFSNWVPSHSSKPSLVSREVA